LASIEPSKPTALILKGGVLGIGFNGFI